MVGQAVQPIAGSKAIRCSGGMGGVRHHLVRLSLKPDVLPPIIQAVIGWISLPFRLPGTAAMSCALTWQEISRRSLTYRRMAE